MAEQNNFVNFNGINAKLAHESVTPNGKEMYNVAIPVPNDVSRNGLANISVPKTLVHPVKDNPEKVNVSVPKDWKLDVNVCKFHDKDDKSKNLFETKEMTPQDLLSKHIDLLKSRKEASKDAEEVEEEAEIDR